MKKALLLLVSLTLAACSRQDADIISSPKPVDFDFTSDPMDSPLRPEYEKAQHLAENGQIYEAETIYATLREKEPNSAHPLVGLAGCQMLRLAPDPAIKLYKEALELNPDSINARIGLGAAYAFAEDYNAALEAYTAAEAIAPEHPMVHWGLVLTYDHLGLEQDARSHLLKFKALSPNSEQIQKLEQLLNNK